MSISAETWSRIRNRIGQAANSVMSFFRTRVVTPPAVDVEPATVSDASSLNSAEEDELRLEIRSELEEGYRLITDRLSSVRQEIDELERQEEEADIESSVLAYGGDGAPVDGGSASALHRSPGTGDLTCLETIDESKEDEYLASGGGDDTGSVDSSDDEFQTPVGGEGDVILDSHEGRVRFDLPPTPLTRTESIRYGRAGHFRRTPYRNVKRVLNPCLKDSVVVEGDQDPVPDIAGAGEELDEGDLVELRVLEPPEDHVSEGEEPEPEHQVDEDKHGGSQ